MERGGVREAPRGAQRRDRRAAPQPRLPRPGPALRGYPPWAWRGWAPHLDLAGERGGVYGPLSGSVVWAARGRPPWLRTPLRLLATSGARPPKSRPPPTSLNAQARGLGGAAVPRGGGTEVGAGVRGTLERARPQEGVEGEKCYLLVFKPRQNSL